DPAARLAAAAARHHGHRRLTERADAIGPLPGAKGVESVGQSPAVRQRQLGVELEQRSEDEAAARHLGMRQDETLGREREIAEQEQVDVERAGAVARGVERATTGSLDLLTEVEQRFGLQLGADADRGVEEVGLVEDLADRLGLISGGDRIDLDTTL